MISSIGELPFRERPALELLHLDDERELPDPDYAGYGWCRVPAIELAAPAGVRVVEDALLLAVHTPDDAEPTADELELEFELDDGTSVTVMLSAFLARWLPRLRGAERAIVLCTCNPHGAVIARPAAAGDAALWYADGDVESWCDDAGRLRLTARAWQEAR